MAPQLGEIYRPGVTIRYRVYDSILGSSSSWSLQTRATTNDVYVMHRESGRHVHASFHHSGESHYALSQEAMLGSSLESRYLEKTNEKNQVAPGFVHPHQVIIAYSELSASYVERVPPRPFIEIPIDRGFDALHINLYIADDANTFARIENALLVAEMNLGKGAIARLVAQPAKYEIPIREAFRSLIEEESQTLVAKGERGENRAVLMVRDDETVGTKYEIEFRLDLPV